MEGAEAVYVVANTPVDPCSFALCTVAMSVAWGANSAEASAEAIGMMSGVSLRCVCGNVQEVHMRDASAVANAAIEFERNLKPRSNRAAAGPKHLTPYERQKLRRVLLNALREAAGLDVNRQVCSKCQRSHSLLQENGE